MLKERSNGGFQKMEPLQFTETEEQLLLKLDEVNRKLYQALENEKKVKRANSRLKSELRKERKEKNELKEQLSKNKKQHYRNGRRGTMFNG